MFPRRRHGLPRDGDGTTAFATPSRKSTLRRLSDTAASLPGVEVAHTTDAAVRVSVPLDHRSGSGGGGGGGSSSSALRPTSGPGSGAQSSREGLPVLNAAIVVTDSIAVRTEAAVDTPISLADTALIADIHAPAAPVVELLLRPVARDRWGRYIPDPVDLQRIVEQAEE